MEKATQPLTHLQQLQKDSHQAWWEYRRGWTPGGKNAEYDLWQQKAALVRAEIERITNRAKELGLDMDICYAYSPRENVNSGGKDHYTLKEDMTIGRLVRQKGDALCKPRRQFWGLENLGQREASCEKCLAILEKWIAKQEAQQV